MNIISLEKKYIFEYIKERLDETKIESFIVQGAKYHHNTNYSTAPSICKHGILTMLDLKNRGIISYSDEILKKMSDIESHINGIDAISLSVVGLQDLYYNEEEYNPFDPMYVDFLVISDIKTYRSSMHYGNEFLSYDNITVDKLKSIDVRLIRLIEQIENERNVNNYSICNIIEKYNYLKLIAQTMKDFKLDIPLREMTYEDNFSMDIDKLSDNPKLVLKKYK